VTAGAAGDNACMLNRALRAGMKNALIGGICDASVIEQIEAAESADTLEIRIGGSIDPASETARIAAAPLRTGVLDADAGISYALLRTGEVDILVTSKRYSFTSPANFEKAGIDINDYSVVVLKLGYLFPLFYPLASGSIMALTPGNATLDTKSIKYTAKADLFPFSR